jgi:hypothetical protein
MGGLDGHFARPIRPSMPSIRRLLSLEEKTGTKKKKVDFRLLKPPTLPAAGSKQVGSWTDGSIDPRSLQRGVS